MTWIKVTSEREAEGELRAADAQVGATRGQVANILKIHLSHNDVLNEKILYERQHTDRLFLFVYINTLTAYGSFFMTGR